MVSLSSGDDRSIVRRGSCMAFSGRWSEYSSAPSRSATFTVVASGPDSPDNGVKLQRTGGTFRVLLVKPAVEASDDIHAYKPFVDGLRAVAILAVVAGHLELPGMAGGYVG